MKLKFSINYRTEWGQQMMVCIAYLSNDGTTRKVKIALNTQDGDYWIGETAVLESRRSPIETFTYYYIVADTDENELRREWSIVPRTYAFDSSHTFIFLDHWRDLPLNSHLYSAAYEVSTQALTSVPNDTKITHKLPLFRKTIMFRVSAPQLMQDQTLAIVGSHPALGAWNPTRYLPMEQTEQKDWIMTLNVDWIGMPLEYKYVVIDKKTNELQAWEEGDNRMITNEIAEGEVIVQYGEPLRLAEKNWRAAGVCIPIFSLRSEHSCGVGDFGDLKRFIDWAEATGLRVIQLLPVNDTTLSHLWSDSYPYNIVSVFALHPQYMDLEQLGTLSEKKSMTAFRRQQRELNALSYCDYQAVERVKTDYVQQIFKEKGEETFQSEAYKEWYEQNKEWLEPYAAWTKEHLEKGMEVEDFLAFTAYEQYHLHVQLKAAADYARSKGIFLKGDLPIGVNAESVETATNPEFFNLDEQTGAPPDAFSINGQNWGFPTYNWDNQERKEWFRRRLQHMEQYFDALRIDHVLGFFRIWEIPTNQVFGTMGHFAPAMPLSSGEIEYFGLPFRKDLFTQPFINDRTIERIFGIHANYVRNTFLLKKAYGLYGLKEEVSTQKKVKEVFEGKGDENSLWIRDGLYRLVANVLFLEDPRQAEMYHPRIMAYNDPVFEVLSMDERDAYMRLYNNFFYQRHSMLWGSTGYQRLTELLRDTHMLVCAEDLGMLPDCVEPVLNALRILTLEIQQMPKETGIEFTHLDGNPLRSVTTISTHDMSPLRLWWEEKRDRAQLFYTTMLQKQGHAPEHLPAHLAEEIIARHLYSPSMLCILSMQDWLAMDSELWHKNPREERINVPSNPYNRWQWRMHLTIEELMEAKRFNTKIKTMVTRSKRA